MYLLLLILKDYQMQLIFWPKNKSSALQPLRMYRTIMPTCRPTALTQHEYRLIVRVCAWTAVWLKQCSVGHCVARYYWKVCNSCLIKTVQRCSLCGVLLLKRVYWHGQYIHWQDYLAVSSLKSPSAKLKIYHNSGLNIWTITLTVRGSTLVVIIWRLQTSDSDD